MEKNRARVEAAVFKKCRETLIRMKVVSADGKSQMRPRLPAFPLESDPEVSTTAPLKADFDILVAIFLVEVIFNLFSFWVNILLHCKYTC